jgi:hypothetical protein
MGRNPWSDRLTVEDCLALDISVLKYDLRRENTVTRAYRWFGADKKEIATVGYKVIPAPEAPPSLLLRYALRDSETQIQRPLAYFVKTGTTACNFGQRRYWFVCPLVRNGVSCRKRVRILYLPPGGRYFGCRSCYNLSYESRQTHDARLDSLLRLPVEELKRVLHDDALKFGTLAFRIGRILRRRLAKKAGKYRNLLFSAGYVPSEDAAQFASQVG